MADHFGDRLCTAVQNKATILTVGLDPVYARLPAQIREHRRMNDENDVAAAVDAIFEFCTRVLRVVAPMVPAVKLNVAFFERYFWEGLEAYYALISEADDLGVETIGDVKRGDIGSTAEQYALAHLQNPEYAGLDDVIVPDAATISGFAGADGIEPFAKVADEQGKGVFVWVRASNPSAAVIQDFADAQGQTFYEKLAEVVGSVANEPHRIGSMGYSNVGMVVGGTSGAKTTELRARYPRLWFLVPGFGSQGATAEDCVRFCNRDGRGALVNASRSILYAYENPEYQERFGENWEKCIEQAVISAKIQLAKAMR